MIVRTDNTQTDTVMKSTSTRGVTFMPSKGLLSCFINWMKFF